MSSPVLAASGHQMHISSAALLVAGFNVPVPDNPVMVVFFSRMLIALIQSSEENTNHTNATMQLCLDSASPTFIITLKRATYALAA